ncbi:DUF721 domain-containing protein [Candidatus Uhrbacteria bacterium]|nr:DUF721 domain-containing protein [Candidatus Uhrbacteria bacterium]
MIDSLKNLLNRKVRATGGGLGERIKASVIVAAVDAAIAAVYPAGAAWIRSRTFREGIVTVCCERAGDAQEVKLKETDILAEANRRLGAGTIKKLRVTC